MEKLDSVDLKILSLLQQNARYTLKDIAKEVELSTPAVSSRLEKLESSNIIKGYTALINYSTLGLNINAIVSVDVIPGTKQEFIEFLKQQKCILSLDWVTGKYSAVVKGVFADIEALNQFNNSLSERFGSSVVQVVLHTDLERTSLKIDDII